MNQENAPISKDDGQEYISWRQTKHEGMNTPTSLIENVIFEATDSRLVKLKRIIAGEVNEVYLAETESGQEIIIRIFHGQKAKFYKEQWVFEQCAKVGAPTPQMLLVKSIEVNGKPLEICIETKLSGTSFDQIPEILNSKMDGERINILHQIGQILSKIHSIPTNGFGPLDRNGNGKFPSIQELISGDTYISRDRILPSLLVKSIH